MKEMLTKTLDSMNQYGWIPSISKEIKYYLKSNLKDVIS